MTRRARHSAEYCCRGQVNATPSLLAVAVVVVAAAISIARTSPSLLVTAQTFQICHAGRQTLTVRRDELALHRQHGDKLGSCDAVAGSPTRVTICHEEEDEDGTATTTTLTVPQQDGFVHLIEHPDDTLGPCSGSGGGGSQGSIVLKGTDFRVTTDANDPLLVGCRLKRRHDNRVTRASEAEAEIAFFGNKRVRGTLVDAVDTVTLHRKDRHSYVIYLGNNNNDGDGDEETWGLPQLFRTTENDFQMNLTYGVDFDGSGNGLLPPPTTNQCKTSLLYALGLQQDSGNNNNDNDNVMDRTEYVRFLQRLSSYHLSSSQQRRYVFGGSTSSSPSFSSLPQLLRDNFDRLGNANDVIPVTISASGQSLSAKDQTVCDDTIQAINDAIVDESEYLLLTRFDMERDGTAYSVVVDLEPILGLTEEERRSWRRRRLLRRYPHVGEHTAVGTADPSSNSGDRQHRYLRREDGNDDGQRHRRLKQTTRRVEMTLHDCNDEPYNDASILLEYEIRNSRNQVREGVVPGGLVDPDARDGRYEFYVPYTTEDNLEQLQAVCTPATAAVQRACGTIDEALGVHSRDIREAIADEVIAGLGLTESDVTGRRLKLSVELALEAAHHACSVIQPDDDDETETPDLDIQICDDLTLPTSYEGNRWELTPNVMYPPNTKTFNTNTGNIPSSGRTTYQLSNDPFPLWDGDKPIIHLVSSTPSNPGPEEGFEIDAVVECVDSEPVDDGGRGEKVQLTFEGDDGFRGTTFCRPSSTGRTTCTFDVAGAAQGVKDTCTVKVTPYDDVVKELVVVH